MVSRKGNFKPGFCDYDCKISRSVYMHPSVPDGQFVKRVFKVAFRLFSAN